METDLEKRKKQLRSGCWQGDKWAAGPGEVLRLTEKEVREGRDWVI